MTETKGRLKLFVGNFLSFGAANALEKVIPIILLPVLTRLLTDTADYGRYDMFMTIVSFGSELVVLGVFDALFREYFEDEDRGHRLVLTSTAMVTVGLSSIFISAAIIIFRRYVSLAFFGDDSNGTIAALAGLTVLMGGVKVIAAAPTRMHNRRLTFISANIVNSAIYYTLAILLVRAGYSCSGMIWSRVICGAGILLFFSVLNRRYFSAKKFSVEAAKGLLKLGLPMAPLFIIYWVFDSMDKIMITQMLGLRAVGIYSAGAKLAGISHVISYAFAGGWQYFAFSTMRDPDQVELNSKVVEYLGGLSFLVFFTATIFDDWFFGLYFSGDYVSGVSVFPYLFLSPLLLMLFQAGANQFLVYKKTQYMTFSLAGGCAANLVLNYFLIRVFGIKGAALATLVGYFVSLFTMLIITTKKGWLKVGNRFYLLSAAAAVQAAALFFFSTCCCLVLAPLFSLMTLLLYKKELAMLLGRILRKKGRRSGMLLRNLNMSDKERMLEWMRSADVSAWFRWDPDSVDEKDVESFIEEAQEFGLSRHYAVADDNGVYMGTVSLKNIDFDNSNAEYAIALCSDAIGRGYAAFATSEILKIAFYEIGLEKVYLNVAENNKRAIRFYEKYGFFPEGVFVKHFNKNGELLDLLWYRMLKEEFGERQEKT